MKDPYTWLKVDVISRFLSSNLWEQMHYWRDFIHPKGHIYVHYSMPFRHTGNYNWGDDVNKYLLELISGKKVIPTWCFPPQDEYYLCIGSILQWFGDPRAIVWGSGLREPLKVKPCKKFFAVRGPLTRKELIKQGYDCPEVYGDPVLLFPRYYNPLIKKKYKIGIIPHFSEQELPFVKELIIKEGLHLIDIAHYGKYTNFIDEVLRCDYVLSSSLHGCIVADAYNVPNLWCQLSDYVAESDGFKFKDYYQSVGKDFVKPFDVRQVDKFSEMPSIVDKLWTENKIDLDKLLASCPFRK